MITTGSRIAYVRATRPSANREPSCGTRRWLGHSTPVDTAEVGTHIEPSLNAIVSGCMNRVTHLAQGGSPA